MSRTPPTRRRARRGAASLAAAALLALPAGGAVGQSQQTLQGLQIFPVTVELSSHQMTAVLNIQNHTDRETDFQVRPYSWAQAGGDDALTPTDVLLVSPPLGRVAVGAGQVVRLVLRQPAQAQEASYRLLLDQVPPPPEPGAIGFALRFSIPVFVEPSARIAPHLRWSVARDAAGWSLVAVNEGGRHDVVHGLVLATADGRRLTLQSNLSPYVLAGATRRWRILTPGFAPTGQPLRLTAHADAGDIDQPVPVTSAAP